MISCLFGHKYEDTGKEVNGCRHDGWTDFHKFGYIAKIYQCERCDAEKQVIIARTSNCYENE